MFLGKLWVRIKGEFLAAREDVSDGLDSRETGKRLLNKIQTILKGETPERPYVPERTEETYQSSSGRREIHDLIDEHNDPKSMEEMERALEELKKTQDQQENASTEPSGPNPRKLG